MKLALIPAKKDSKRLPNKNFKKFCGTPMIELILNEIKKTKYFDKIVVSTDKLNLKNKTFYEDIEISLRPKHLTHNKIGLIDIVKYVYQQNLNNNIVIDQLWLFLPCSPLIFKKDILRAIKVFNKNKKFPLISVAKFPAPIEWALYESKGYLSPLNFKKITEDSKNLKNYFYDTGNFIAYSQSHLNSFSMKMKYQKFLIPNFKAVDIDDLDDWNLAKILYRNLINE